MPISATAIPAAKRADSAALYLTVMAGTADFLAALPAGLWDAATDCAGWTVRDVVGHLVGAQEDILSVRSTLRHRQTGRRRYPSLSPLDAANQAQVDDHAGQTTTDLVALYRANAPKVAARVASFSRLMGRISVQADMAPGGAALRLGYLYNVIYLRDAWMHGIDLARATGLPRPATDADGPILEQIMRDASVEWVSRRGASRDAPRGTSPVSAHSLTVELSGEISGAWHLGGEGPQARVSGVGLETVRGLSGRTPDSGLICLEGDPDQVGRLAALRILF
ncbi:hypothetical protein CVV68_03920 [Arthrobacter livingstonensis]|uniref:Mycothiol-dependent maleylpyruvate isomerase metal-binding domain-containing protein n=1 Tax=Arthrobacter livingstonensis TaxID=670078 RepID=A0A2V5LMQ2_9MICC|nr:maleylpyruvate isomerase family mycothiol-dependent enzyme [Arthrobacter livingstonensis]PYI68960.1 hypothetical protein CVV68_03920 [Arthrobacter livingstonensis]